MLLLPSKASSKLLNDNTSDAFVRVIVSSIRTNRARCILSRKIFDLLDEESVSGESSGYNFDEKSYCECLKRCVDS